MSRLRFSAPSVSWVAGLWLFLLLGEVLRRVLDREPLDLRTLLAAWAVVGAITLLPYGVIRLAIQRRTRP